MILKTIQSYRCTFLQVKSNIENCFHHKVSVDGVVPANMSGDLPGKKSQLDLRPFGVVVPTLGRTVMP